MVTVEIQVHGYRKGHQLLASSVVLPKEDQAVVDRLSDVAGPLRPREHFAPYLSAYPLPSGLYYVIARTWQDLTVPRAGCVRTKSVLVDARVWSQSAPLIPIFRLLSSVELPSETEASRVELDEHLEQRFPRALDFSAGELLEALFLEDVKPVVVFDAPEPELIALRLLTALWPDIRRRFALSTFALSPRKIGGRDLDLVFAPSNAKSKFSDWSGRRVDGRSSQTDRHRWTGAIVRRVFEEPLPRLLSDSEIRLLGDRDADSAAVLRIALLWDELLEKLDRTPTAVLGLLDIANSGMISNAAAMKTLEPRLAEATLKAADTLALNDAWDFVGAIARKIQGQDMPAGKLAVEKVVTHLAERAPDCALSLLRQPDPKGAIINLIPSIATGLGKSAAPHLERVLVEAPADTIARLVAQGGALTGRVAANDELIEKMGGVLAEVDRELASRAGMMLLSFLVEDRHLPAAVPIFDTLDPQGIASELNWLGETNQFQAKRLCTLLIHRAREIGALKSVRDVLILAEASRRRDALLAQALEPVTADIHWLLEENRLSITTSNALLVGLLRRADHKELATLFSDRALAEHVLTRLSDDGLDLLVNTAMQDSLPINSLIRIVRSILPKLDNFRKYEIADKLIGRCLRNRFEGDEIEILCILLGTLGARLDGRQTVRTGLELGVDTEIVARNLIAFERAPLSARKRIMTAVDEIALLLHKRSVIDLGEAANDACAKLMVDAEDLLPNAISDAAGWLLPSLFRARREPISAIIAALFPVVYRALPTADDVPDFIKLVPFFEWDRRKSARRDLVNAFMLSSWNAGDLALTAFRCGDVAKILKRVASSYGGAEYLEQIENDLSRLDVQCRHSIKSTIAEIRSNTSYKFDL